MRVPTGQVIPRGWALECRITSEDATNGFLPATGRLEYLRPPAGPGVRWDGGFETGNEVTLFYDSLLGKIIVWGRNRHDAIIRMRRALQELIIVGVPTNQPFHLRLLQDPDFLNGNIDSQLLDRRPDLTSIVADPESALGMAVAAALAEDEARQSRRPAVERNDCVAATTEQGNWLRTARRESLRNP